jgi:hypothetical protein
MAAPVSFSRLLALVFPGKSAGAPLAVIEKLRMLQEFPRTCLPLLYVTMPVLISAINQTFDNGLRAVAKS